METATGAPDALADLRRGAAELARGIAERRWSAREIVAAHIARIEAVDPVLNAVVVRRFDAARAEADRADLAVRDGTPLGPLHGVPITIKEQFAVAGTPASLGVAGARDDDRDGPLVARLRAAGAIVWQDERPATADLQRSRHPVYADQQPVGTGLRASGGAAAARRRSSPHAVSPLGLGSDIGGSLRAPSHALRDRRVEADQRPPQQRGRAGGRIRERSDSRSSPNPGRWRDASRI